MPHEVPRDVQPTNGDAEWTEATALAYVIAAKNAGRGCNIEWDVHVPQKLHDFFAQLPPVVEKCELREDDLSPHTKEMRTKGKLGSVNGITRLLATLHDKKNLLSDGRYFHWLINKGVVAKKIHSVQTFGESKWMAPFIHKCVLDRQNAKNELAKQQAKLAMVSNFGKMMQDTLRYRNIKLVSKDSERVRLQSRFEYAGLTHVLGTNESADPLWLMEMRKIEAKMDQPTYVGFTILERSKLHMMSKYYDTLLPMWGTKDKKLELLYMDTDSLVISVTTNDHSWNMYEDMAAHPEVFDLTKYGEVDDNGKKKSDLHAYYNPKQAENQLGLLKDDLGNPLWKWECLAPKCYSCVAWMDGKEKQKKAGKGIPKYLLARKTHEEFVAVNAACGSGREEGAGFTGVHMMTSHRHQIKTVVRDRVGLNSMDVKRWRLANGDSLPYGHCRAIEEKAEIGPIS